MNSRRPGSALLLLVIATGLTVKFFATWSPPLIGSAPIQVLKAAATLYPSDPEVLRRLGIAWIQRGETERGIDRLKKSLERNPLAPDTWIALARTHMNDPVMRQTHFEIGIEEARTAARLGAGRPGLSMSVGLMLLRLWPLLDQDARDECLDRLKRAVTRMGPQEVDILARDWFRYSRSWPLLAKVMEASPDACQRTADRLMEKGASLEWRWRLLAAAERRKYAVVRNILDEEVHRDLRESELEEMIRLMDEIRGYARLVDPGDKDWIRYRNFRDELLYKTMIRAVRRYRRRPHERSRQRVLKCLSRLLSRPRTLDLSDLPLRLEEIGIWKKTSDSLAERMRIRLDFYVGDHAGALERAEQLVPAVKPAVAIQVRLLAAKAAMAVRLMTSALRHVNAVLQVDSANLEALWLRTRIKRVLGEPVEDGDMRRLRQASLVTLVDGSADIAVPLVKGVRVEIAVPAGALGKRRMLKVIVDGAVFLEKYLDANESRTWLDLEISDELDRMPRVQVGIFPLSG